MSPCLSEKHVYWNLKIHCPAGRSPTTAFWPRLARALQTTKSTQDKEKNDGMRTEDLQKNLKSLCGTHMTDI